MMLIAQIPTKLKASSFFNVHQAEDEMMGWHHQLNGHEFEQTQGDSERQGSLHAAIHGVAE